jgi:RNA polymerase sigma-70 factor (ECF subfamily)
LKQDDQQSQAERFLGLLRPIERDLEIYCRRLIFHGDDVPDAIQNAVLRSYRAFDRYHDDASFRGWMFKILTNEVFSLNRKRGRRARFEIPLDADVIEESPAADTAELDPLPSWEILAEALDQDLVAALRALNDNERAVLLLRALGHLRYREVGDALEMPLGSVMGTLARARQKMRTTIVAARRRATL